MEDQREKLVYTFNLLNQFPAHTMLAGLQPKETVMVRAPNGFSPARNHTFLWVAGHMERLSELFPFPLESLQGS